MKRQQLPLHYWKGGIDMDMDTLGFFLYMEKQEKDNTNKNYSQNENAISKENEPPKTQKEK